MEADLQAMAAETLAIMAMAADFVASAKVQPQRKTLFPPLHHSQEENHSDHLQAKVAKEKEEEVHHSAHGMFPLQPQSTLPFYLRVRQSLPWWQQNASQDRQLLQILSEGLNPSLPDLCHLQEEVQCHTPADLQAAQQVLEDYARVGAVKEVPPDSDQFLVPWFIIRKQEETGEKVRLISDCRQLNLNLCPPKFRLDHLQNIFPVLKKGLFAAKIDLQHAYFHLGIHPSKRKYFRHQVGEKIWEFQAACFGLSILPELWMRVMKPLQKLWRAKGLLVYTYLDDILLLGETPSIVQKNLQIVLQTLQSAGLQINHKKCILEPCQEVKHLGFILDLKEGFLRVPKEKLKSVRRELGKLVTHSHITKRKMSSILGQVRSFLTAMPFLRAFSDQMVFFLKENHKKHWDQKLEIPSLLQDQIREIKDLTLHWDGRAFGSTKTTRFLASDSSQESWAGLDLKTGQAIQEFWRGEKILHINLKELRAAVNCVMSLAQKRDKVHLLVDNSVTFYYLKKGGGKIKQLNHILRPFLLWCLKNQVTLQVELCKSADMPADYLTRMPKDKGDYTLNQDLFLFLKRQYHHWLDMEQTIDMFASPGNFKFKKFCSRHPHWQSWGVDSLNMSLKDLQFCYSNPPWTVIQNWLLRLKQNPHITCWMICPMWVGATWWPLLLKLLVPLAPQIQINPFPGMFQNCWGELMPSPKWHLVSVILSGKFWKGTKYKFTPSKLTWIE